MVESTVDLVKHAFAVLSGDGILVLLLQETFFSPSYGVVHDKYGVMWTIAAMLEDQ